MLVLLLFIFCPCYSALQMFYAKKSNNIVHPLSIYNQLRRASIERRRNLNTLFDSIRLDNDDSTDRSQDVRSINSDDPKDRFYLTAALHMAAKKRGLIGKERCMRCFMTQAMCICSRVKDILSPIDIGSSKLNTRMLVYMHYKEWGRASNTGKIMNIGMPNKSEVFIFGRKDDETRLLEAINAQPTLIVYPSAEARSAAEYSDWVQQQSKPVNLIVLDTTWGNSKTMERSLPAHIPRVKVDSLVSGPSQFLNRKQSMTATKISTIEAMAFAMRAVGETEESINLLLEALRYSVDAVLCQAGKPVAYNHTFVEQITSVNAIDAILSPYSASSVERPDHCPFCGVGKEHTIFKNKGLGRPRRKAPFALSKSASATANIDNVQASAVGGAALSAVTSISADDLVSETVAAKAVVEGTSIESEEYRDDAELCRFWKCRNCEKLFVMQC